MDPVAIETFDGEIRFVPRVAARTFTRKFEAVKRMQALGGTKAPANEETIKLMNTIQNANRRIKAMGWYST